MVGELIWYRSCHTLFLLFRIGLSVRYKRKRKMKVDNLEVLKFEAIRRGIENKSLKWTCKDGREIPIADMSDTHLSNTIQMIERNRQQRQEEEDNYWDAVSGAPSDLFY